MQNVIFGKGYTSKPAEPAMPFNYNDGGRSNYYKAENVGDCVTRAIAIAAQKDYKEVYDLVNAEEKKARKYKGSARNGAFKHNFAKVIEKLGGKWVSCMSIGSGCKVHLKSGDLPANGRIVCRLSKHLVAVIDGVLNDTYDCSREGKRCVYGYWVF